MKWCQPGVCVTHQSLCLVLTGLFNIPFHFDYHLTYCDMYMFTVILGNAAKQTINMTCKIHF